MSDFIVEVKSVSKNFNGKSVLNDLSLNVPKGSVFGLLGKNGSGKTTLIKCLLGLLKPQKGEVVTIGDNPLKFKNGTKEKLGYVPQADRIYPWLTVRQAIDYTETFYTVWDAELVNKLVSIWELKETDKVGMLSEGQVQKLSIILSLGHRPELLVFDEPVASLDPAARRQFIKMILDLVADRECTIFFSTHITTDLERVADRVALLKDGKIDFCGGLDELKDEVKRLRVTSKDPIKESIEAEGVLSCEILNNEAVISVRGFNEGMKKQLESKFNAEVQVENLNLEEIFLELNR
ncbi:MAG: ABC transporter ATP-binding protein [Omnitrophica WOR_2 bacterium GWF2_38_59]|nr:MAG: ABC transporter ATP-binding protein [Omnitrophica WOR_2 bacterium GWF2_38_59]OGX52131.1 MAG: ABC transporter ATP-binding protein [Omnitrophica WOR_2 bacterium RIFOXYA12_FULL_38_10]OGX57028.1 MAG: ABC transporter ATP-binding protein [Omnitrophica WOR_2 bacterium RIFOXYC2_FULL_38_12]OGX59899.1 MAG: ABC transporter ATP-binding protein [Omnitrophica WOR_2 bacterium RIFOXYB2_FULL_38_16]HBG62430.1 ABC transporter ATP-binding protein [Candidatus Omnitrophota bacterium]